VCKKKKMNKIKKEKEGKMERNFLTAFDTANSARYLFSKLVRLPLTPRYFVKYHTLSEGAEGEGHFCRRVKRSLLGEREKKRWKKKNWYDESTSISREHRPISERAAFGHRIDGELGLFNSPEH